jgi:hypothetical protein
MTGVQTPKIQKISMVHGCRCLPHEDVYDGGVQTPKIQKINKDVVKPNRTHVYKVRALMSIKLILGSLQAIDN